MEIERRSTHRPYPRLRHGIGPWRPLVARTCIDCGLCVPACPTDVFYFMPGRRHLAVPREERCLGMVACGACVPACPAGAITITPGQNWAALGDDYLSNAIIASIWEMAEHGTFSPEDPVSVGASGRGFDRLGIVVPAGGEPLIPGEVDLRVSLHHRGRALWIEQPAVGGPIAAHRSSAEIHLARAAAARALGTFTLVSGDVDTSALEPYMDWLIIEGGTLLLARASAIAIRCGASHVHTLADLAKQLDWLRLINPQALIIVRLEASISLAQTAAVAAQAGAHVIHIHGGGAPLYVADRVHDTHRFLQAKGLRDRVSLIAGGIRTPLDLLKAVALGADAGALDWAEQVALGMTHDTSTVESIDPEWGARRLVNLHLAWAAEWRRTLALLGLPSLRALCGRADLLVLVE